MPPPSLRSEALLYAEWVRGAVGRFTFDDLPVGPTARPAASSPSGVTAVQDRGGDPPSPVRRGLQSGSAQPLHPPESRGELIISDSIALSTPRVEPSPEFEELRATALACRRCSLCESRTQVVFGEGARRPALMVVGEAPGADEDASGRPFVGRAGQLLTRMLAAIGLGRDDVYIANVLKCRPPENRPPAPEEIAACRPFLREQIAHLEPRLLLLLGNHATRAVLGIDRGITSIRGRLMESPEGWKTLPTYHPAYLLRNPDAKREAWADLLLAAATLGLSVPGRPSPDA